MTMNESLLEAIPKPLDIPDFSDPGFLHTVTQNELLDKPLLEEPDLIQGFLVSGVTLLVGSPKVGKSFLVLQIAYHISTGKPLWDFPIQQAEVLYLALEDTERRLQKRSFRMFGEAGTDFLHFAVVAKTINCGLLDQLQYFLKRHPNTRLVIVDTMQFSREDTPNGNLYVADTAFMKTIQAFSKETGVNILLVHHTRKAPDQNDSFNTISGSNGNMGGADSVIIMGKEKRTDERAFLKCTGRDTPDQIFWIRRNPGNLCWELEEVEKETWKDPPDPILESVHQLLRDNPTGWSGSASELAQALNTDLSPNALSRRMNLQSSRLMREYGITYNNQHTREGSKITLFITQSASDDCDAVTMNER